MTTDLAEFGDYWFRVAKIVIDAYLASGFPSEFEEEGVRLALHDGEVYFTNSEYQLCTECDGVLEMAYALPIENKIGFYEDLLVEVDSDWYFEDVEFVRDLALSRNDTEGVEKCNNILDMESEVF